MQPISRLSIVPDAGGVHGPGIRVKHPFTRARAPRTVLPNDKTKYEVDDPKSSKIYASASDQTLAARADIDVMHKISLAPPTSSVFDVSIRLILSFSGQGREAAAKPT